MDANIDQIRYMEPLEDKTQAGHREDSTIYTVKHFLCSAGVEKRYIRTGHISH